ncbi:MAG: dihydroneopterin aldolase family protein [Haloarculaceae archaeon]
MDDTGREPSDAEVACFEAGVKFGTVYHQFAGTPLSPDSADSLARAMEEAIENQPHCESVTVEPRYDELERAVESGAADYVEWTGRFADVRMTVRYEGVTVHTRMAMQDGYPLMEVVDVRE